MNLDVKKFEDAPYPLYIIDTKRGNSFAVTFNVNVGSWHEKATDFPGRAHLWEHVIHLGSEKHPGPSAFDEQIERLGADYNAYTSNNRTFFYGSVHEERLLEMIDLLGSTISSPCFEAKAFERERRVVMNEVLEYQRSNVEALEASFHLLLFPESHPLHMFYLGTPDQLESIRLSDLKSFYKDFYHALNAEIIVAGNFSRGSVSRDDLIGSVRRFFEPKQGGIVAGDSQFPSILSVSSEAPRFVELESQDDQRLLSVLFELPEPIVRAHYEMLEIIIDFFNLDFTGSIAEFLESKLWINDVSMQLSSVNNLHMIEIQFDLTEEGAGHRDEVVKTYFSAISKLCREAIPNEIFNFLKASSVNQQIEEHQEPRKSADLFADYLARGLDWKSASHIFDRYQACQASTWQDVGSELFRPNHFLLSYMAPEVKGETEFSDFNRKYRYPRGSSLIADLNDILHSDKSLSYDFSFPAIPEISLVETYDASVEYKEPEILVSDTYQVQLALEELPNFPTGSCILRLESVVHHVFESLRAKLLVDAFEFEQRDFLSYIDGRGLFQHFRYDAGNLHLCFKGNSRSSRDALSMFLDRFLGFTASKESWSYAIDQLRASVLENQHQFSSTIASKELLDDFNDFRFSDSQQIEALADSAILTPASVKAVFSKLNPRLLLVGNYSPDIAREMAIKVSSLFPNRLNADEIRKRSQAFLEIESQNTKCIEMNLAKEQDAYGIARIYAGPDKTSPDFALGAFVMSVLGHEVFQLNRTQRELGYIHSCELLLHGGKSLLHFYGQTNGEDNLQSVVGGWREVIESFQSKQNLSSYLADYQRGYVQSRKVLANTDVELAKHRLSSWIQYSDLLGYEKITETIEAIHFSDSACVQSFVGWIDRYLNPKAVFSQALAYRTKPSSRIFKAIR